MQDLKNIIESLLFVADETLSVDKIRGIVETSEPKDIRNALQELGADYETRGGGFYLSEVAGGFQLRSRPVYHEYIKRLLQPSPHRLSRAALETLALIAYRQPIIRSDIEHIRGVDCGAMLRQLMERKLIRVLGRKEIPGRPLIYATTKSFLELFELKDLSELPTPAEIEQIRGAKDAGNAESNARAVSETTEAAADARPTFNDDPLQDEKPECLVTSEPASSEPHICEATDEQQMENEAECPDAD